MPAMRALHEEFPVNDVTLHVTELEEGSRPAESVTLQPPSPRIEEPFTVKAPPE